MIILALIISVHFFLANTILDPKSRSEMLMHAYETYNFELDAIKVTITNVKYFNQYLFFYCEQNPSKTVLCIRIHVYLSYLSK